MLMTTIIEETKSNQTSERKLFDVSSHVLACARSIKVSTTELNTKNMVKNYTERRQELEGFTWLTSETTRGRESLRIRAFPLRNWDLWEFLEFLILWVSCVVCVIFTFSGIFRSQFRPHFKLLVMSSFPTP